MIYQIWWAHKDSQGERSLRNTIKILTSDRIEVVVIDKPPGSHYIVPVCHALEVCVCVDVAKRPGPTPITLKPFPHTEKTGKLSSIATNASDNVGNKEN